MPQGAWPVTDVIILGKDAKVRVGPAYTPSGFINGPPPVTMFALGCRSGSITIYGDQHEIGDTEDTSSASLGVTGYKAFQTGRNEADIELNWYRHISVIPQASLPGGPQFDVDAYLSFWFSPAAGQAFPSSGTLLKPYQFPIINVNRYGNPFDINQPQEGRVTGKSSGPFYTPTS